MITKIAYKKQGDGRDSWIKTFFEDDDIEGKGSWVLPPEIVYENPEMINKSDQTVLGLVYEMSPNGIEELRKIMSGDITPQQRTRVDIVSRKPDLKKEYNSSANWFQRFINWVKRIFKRKK